MIKWVWLSVLVVIADQATKTWADSQLTMHQPVNIFETVWNSGLNFTLAYNTGAAYSFLSDAGGIQHYLFSALAVLISIYIIYTLWKMPSKDLQQAIAFAMVLGGAVGNLIDRLIYQHVIDFIDLYFNNIHLFGHFNIADVAISIGAVLLILEAFNIKIIRRRAISENHSVTD